MFYDKSKGKFDEIFICYCGYVCIYVGWYIGYVERVYIRLV